MASSNSEAPLFPAMNYWRGLGLWNLYFLGKLALAWFGALNFHALENLAFAAALLCPLPPLWLHRLRHALAVPVGAALLYYDTWFPPFTRLLESSSEIAGFSADYLLELAERLVNWNMVAGGIVLAVAYLFFSQWLRLTTVSLVALAYLAVAGMPPPVTITGAAAPVTPAANAAAMALPGSAAAAATAGVQPAQALPPTNDNLNAYLDAFYKEEQQRKTLFPPPAAAAVPFDLLIVNICSLSWSDLDAVNLRDHPLFGKMDIIFDNFNSATSYSGPAAIRLLRASCGQESHSKLYEGDAPQCFLFENLGKLGFAPELALNHTGQYQDYLQSVREQGNMPAPVVETASLRNPLVSFDGTPIWRDLDVLDRWWQQRQTLAAPRTAMFYNTITLHDGNRAVLPNGATQRIDYRPRAQKLLDDLSTFVDQLQRSGRPVLVAIVPEHGAALHGDRMQIDGMREIPSPSITHVPVAIKLVGMKNPHVGPPIRIAGPSSYLALSAIAARLADGRAFVAEQFDWSALVADLPETAPVSENQGTVVIEYQGSPFVRMQGAGWLPYPR